MNVKKLVAGVLACCVVGGVMPFITAKDLTNAMVEAEHTEGTYESLEYKNYGDYIEISGCDSKATEVVIPAKIDGVSVTNIGNTAFSDCMNLTSITIPDSVISIDGHAFDDTPWLESKRKENSLVIVNDILIDGKTCSEDVLIPDNVKSISNYAFSPCESLTKIIIPDSVTSIGGGAFSYCSNLISITVPESVVYIGGYAFGDCENLEKITILNPDCKIIYSYGDSYGHSYGTIYGYEDSTAQAYAEKYGREFVSLGKAPTGSDETNVLLGDANVDGEVNMADVTAIIQHIGNHDTYALTEQGEVNADCDTQEGITGNDALAVQLLLAKQIDKLPYTE